jgi:hypothetical protein
MPHGVESTANLTFSPHSSPTDRAAATSKRWAHGFDIRPWRAPKATTTISCEIGETEIDAAPSRRDVGASHRTRDLTFSQKARKYSLDSHTCAFQQCG